MGDRYGRRDHPGGGPRGSPRGGGRFGERERERSGTYPRERGGERERSGSYPRERGGYGVERGVERGVDGHRPEGRPTSSGRGGGGRDYSGEKRDFRGGMRGGPRGGGGGGRGAGGGFGAAFSRPNNPREQVPDGGELIRLDDLPPAVTPEDLNRLAFTPAHALRPGFGSAGRGVSVKANWFKTELTLDEAYQFDVDIRAIRRDGTIVPSAEEEGEAKEEQASTTKGAPAPPQRGGPPPRPQRPLRAETSRLVMLELAKTLKWRPGCWAFDGRKVMYSPMSELASAEGLRAEVEIEPDDEPGTRRYLVIIRPVSVINFSGLRAYLRAGERLEESESVTHALQCLDIVLRQRAAHTPGALVFARSIHFRGDRPQRIGEGAEVWLGYQQSVRPCLTGLALNVDQSATAVLEELPLIEFCEALAGGPLRGPLPDGVRMKLNRALRNIKISTTHTKFVKAIRHLTSTSPFEETFERDGKTVSIADYMLAQYNIRLSRRDLPCVAVGNGRILLPMELCRIAPRQRVRKPTESQTSELIRVAAQRPADRARHIEEAVNKQVDVASDPTARAFGLRVNNRMMDVQARVLPHPALSYGSPANFDPRNQGAWNLKEVRFLNGSELPSWACVCFANPRGASEDLESTRGAHGPTFMGEFIDMLNKCGIRTPREAPPVLYPGRGESAYDSLRAASEAAAKAFGGKPAALILVVLPDTGAALYKEVKQAGDSLVGLPTQCVVARKAGIGCPPRGRLQYCANVAMKVNAKLGGCNVRLGSGQRLPVLQSGRPFMILGADVTHPTGDEGGPSVAAVVASVDATATRYAARVSMQRGRQEIIADLKAMVKSLLLEFYRATKGLKPEAIVFYRDGVAESQFREVYYKEYSALREACAEMSDADYRPPITLVIVQKRHHTRLFPQPNDNQNRDRSGNILPGTVVDRDIAHPHNFSFFLNSHAGIQGTSKPSHYSVLVDENRFGADGMQMLTYHLCYLFCRCSRSISLCSPAMYAHLAAFRGRIMIRRGDDSDSASLSSGGVDRTGIEFMSINPKLGQGMFYV